jgi:hypothetical protein
MRNAAKAASKRQSPPTEKFQFTFTSPYSSFVNGVPAPVPYVVEGLFIQGGLSITAAKPKHGKSTLSRCSATCVTQGSPFLGRETVQGDVILINLEDPLWHVGNSLSALGYREIDGHGKIVVTERLHPSIDANCDALGNELAKRSDVRLVIVDTLAKFLQIKDWSENMPVQRGFQRLHDIAREYSHVHIHALVHCKKVETSDPFDQILGSTALRGEPDTNVVIFQQNGERFITTETRVGRPLPPTLLKADVATVAGADVVTNFYLGLPLGQLQAESRDRAATSETVNYAKRVVDYLQSCPGNTALQQNVLANVTGKDDRLLSAIHDLVAMGAVVVGGPPRTLTLVGN